MPTWLRSLALSLAFAVAIFGVAGPAGAQTKLKWAHVYEVLEPYHTEALWAAEEIKKRTDGRYEIGVFPASQLGNENQINEGLGLGTVDIIYTGVVCRLDPQAALDHRRAVYTARLRPLEGIPREQAIP